MDETATLEVPQGEISEVQNNETSEIVATEPKESTEQQTTPPDGRRNPDATRRALKFLRDNEEFKGSADQISKDLADVQTLRRFFPKIGDARKAFDGIQAIGGVDKLAELQTYGARMRDIDDRLANGDVSVVDAILETGSQGVIKILPALIQKLQASNANEMAQVAQPLAKSFMDTEGLPDAIDSLANLFNDQSMKPEEKLREIAKIVKGMVGWYKGLGSKEGKTDPEREAFEKERSTYQQERYEGEINQVFNGPNGVMEYAQKKIDAKLLADAKKLGISGDTEYIDLLRNDIWKRLEQKRNADAFFKAGREEKFNERSKKVAQDAATWINGFTDKYFDEAYKLVMGPRLKGTESKPAVVAKTSPTAAPTNAAPNFDNNMTLRKLGNREAVRDALLAGKGYASNGKPIKKVGRVWQFA